MVRASRLHSAAEIAAPQKCGLDISMTSNEKQTIIDTVLQHFPNVQGIYLFGSYGTEDQWPESDVDVALLLPPEESKKADHISIGQCRLDLEKALHKKVDLLDARQISTVFQKEIIAGDRCMYRADLDAIDEFEMLVLSFYQKLNEERREILAAFDVTGRAYDV